MKEHFVKFVESASHNNIKIQEVNRRLHNIEEQERIKNRVSIKLIQCCTDFIHNILNTTNFKMIDSIMAYGWEELNKFLRWLVEMIVTKKDCFSSDQSNRDMI